MVWSDETRIPEAKGLPARPSPPVTLGERVRRWVEWVGAGRVATAGVMVLAVVAAGYWLVRPPDAATEARLPLAPGAAAVSSVPSPSASEPTRSGADDARSVIVHVAGAVMVPGVHEVPEGARVFDALAAAGGATADGTPDALNLAAVVVDGQRIYVPRVGEPLPPSSDGAGAAMGPLNINTASAAALESLPGIGPALAAAIVTHRDEHGPFATVDALSQVPGIGPATVEQLRAQVTV